MVPVTTYTWVTLVLDSVLWVSLNICSSLSQGREIPFFILSGLFLCFSTFTGGLCSYIYLG